MEMDTQYKTIEIDRDSKLLINYCKIQSILNFLLTLSAPKTLLYKKVTVILNYKLRPRGI